MDLVQAVILGLIQGVLEWLPVSSQGVSSIVLTQFLSLSPEASDSAAVFLHSGTALSALIYFREDFRQLLEQVPSYLKKMSKNRSLPEDYELMNFLLVASAFSGMSGLLSLLTKDYIFQNLVSSSKMFTGLVGVALLITGILKFKEKEGVRISGHVNSIDGAVAGFLQGLAFIPGISRSGITVFGLFMRDFSSSDAFRLSFLMSVPAIMMGQVAIGLIEGFTPSPEILLASFVSFLSGIVSIDIVLRIAERVKVEYICFGLAAVIFLSLII